MVDYQVGREIALLLAVQVAIVEFAHHNGTADDFVATLLKACADYQEGGEAEDMPTTV